MPELRVSIAKLKARLSEYLAAAKAGQGVVITDRGRPVARLTPLSGGRLITFDERLGLAARLEGFSVLP